MSVVCQGKLEIREDEGRNTAEDNQFRGNQLNGLNTQVN
jgi:hypothetical protein